MADDRGVASVCRVIARHRVELLPTSPSFLNLLLISGAPGSFDLSSLALITYGTEVMPERTLKMANEVFPGVRFLQTYGLSELGILRSKSESDDSLRAKIGGEDYETRVVDGRLLIRARSSMLGYLNAPSNLAVWSYFKGGKRFHGDLEGNIFSVTFQEGWIRIIPLKDDVYSVGVVGDKSSSGRMRNIGIEAFYEECLGMCPLAAEVLEGATRWDIVRVIRDWAYDAASLSLGRAFLCGDSACFIDPLFSQGVHLATYSAMMAAAGIDHLYRHPGDADEIGEWYERSYRAAYNRYHEFLAAFYSANSGLDSTFWRNRQIAGAGDARFKGKDWFTALSGQQVDAGARGIEELEARASTLANLWQHEKN